MLHINIASLGKHIDELRSLLNILNYPFDIIGITETRLYDECYTTNIDLEGYNFRHTPTETQCGGAGLYIKSCYDFEVHKKLSQCNHDISESIFIELKIEGRKNLLIGCIYRHHTPISSFVNSFLNNALETISKQSNKICALMGDFNVDLLKYDTHSDTGNFYDLLSSHNFRPLILQPTRVTSKTSSLIDNIFINDVSCHSVGGNITSAISDHYFQFSQVDIFQKFISPK